MSLKYYRFDCTGVPDSDMQEVEQLIDWCAFDGRIWNYNKEPNVSYAFVDESVNMELWSKSSPALKNVIVTNSIPD